jgi:hypothetical protein
MTGNVRGFVAKMRKVNPEIKFDHCLVHREVTIANTPPGVLKNAWMKLQKTIPSSNSSPSVHGIFFGILPETWY